MNWQIGKGRRTLGFSLGAIESEDGRVWMRQTRWWRRLVHFQKDQFGEPRRSLFYLESYVSVVGALWGYYYCLSFGHWVRPLAEIRAMTQEEREANWLRYHPEDRAIIEAERRHYGGSAT
jgi:hypothetical protein